MQVQMIPLDEIIEVDGPEPTKELICSIRKKGVWQPVLLDDPSRGEEASRYRILDGNRRIAALRLIGEKDVPAIVYSYVGQDVASEVTLFSNNMRSQNPYQELRSYARLANLERPDDQIRADTGMGKAVMDKYRRWSHANAGLVSLFFDRGIAPSVMDVASKLTPEQQDQLERIAQVKRRITIKDVNDVIEETREPEPELSDLEQFNNSFALMQQVMYQTAVIGQRLGYTKELMEDWWGDAAVKEIGKVEGLSHRDSPDDVEVPF